MLTKHHVYVEIVKDITPRNLKRKTLYQDNTKTKKISNAPPPPKKNLKCPLTRAGISWILFVLNVQNPNLLLNVISLFSFPLLSTLVAFIRSMYIVS